MRTLLLALVLAIPAHAGKTIACQMGAAKRMATVLFEIEGHAVLFSAEGDSEKTSCVLVPDPSVDYRVSCNSDTPEDHMSMWIRRSRGQILDAEGAKVADLRNCRTR